MTASSNGTQGKCWYTLSPTLPEVRRASAAAKHSTPCDSGAFKGSICGDRIRGIFFFRNFRSKPNGSTTCEAHSKELGERMSPERRRRELSTVLLQAQKLASPAEASRRPVLASAINDEDSPQS